MCFRNSVSSQRARIAKFQAESAMYKRVLKQNSKLKSARYFSADFKHSLICDSERIIKFENGRKRNFAMK